MPKYRYDIKQNTDEWSAVKVGKISASVADKLLMDKKTKGYQGLIDRLVEERITGLKCESETFKGNGFTERGHELEPVAADDYDIRNFAESIKVGVVELDDWCLCSPDRLIDDDGLLQIKCPIFNTQKEYLKTKKVPTNYYKQMQFELFVTERKYNVFCSYHPNLPALDIVVNRDEEMIEQIKVRIEEVKKEVESEIKYLKSL